MTKTERDRLNQQSTLTNNQVELLAYHLASIYSERGKFWMGVGARLAEVTIAPNRLSDGDDPEMRVWDSVTINGHSVGNRHGGAKAYTRFVSGDPDWHRAK